MILLILFVFILVISAVICHYSIDLSKYEISSKKLPKEFDSFKIIHLSDLHSREIGENNIKLINKIKKQNPNVIIMTGDMINGKYENILQMEFFLRELKKICDIYYILGNREFEYNRKLFDEFASMLKRNKVTLLTNDKCEIKINNEYINIYGINYCNRDVNEYYANRKNNYVPKKKYISRDEIIEHKLEEILPKLDYKKYNVLLAHDPLQFEQYSKHGFDLVLAGHVHGGIVRIPFIGGVLSPDVSLFPKYDKGVFNKENASMCVSRGLGYGTIPFRIFNNPEIVQITLKSEE